MTNHQRIGAISNAHAGRDFEGEAREYFRLEERLNLQTRFEVLLGVGERKKTHGFDLGSEEPAVLVECKSHNWTETGNMPSAKVTVWNEAMYFFHLAPIQFRKILFVLSARHPSRRETLAEYYVRLYSHLIPDDVSILEYEPTGKQGRLLKTAT